MVRRGVRHKLAFLLEAVAAGDYAFRFTEKRGRWSKRFVNQTLNGIRDIIVAEKQNVAEREEFYGRILDSASTGIMVVEESGAIVQTNAEAGRILRMDVLTHLKQLARVGEGLPGVFEEMGAGEKRRVSYTDERGEVTLAVGCSEVETGGKRMRVFALSEIGDELAQQEVEAWEKLTRVLTHEIMNSITPITSLSNTLTREEGLSDDVRRGLEAIRDTGEGLTRFVEAYRRLTRLPEPRPGLVDVKPLLERAAKMVEGVEVEVRVEREDMIVWADEDLVFQVVVNLMKNAAQALEGKEGGKIVAGAKCAAGEQVVITVTDNGPGITEEALQHIFTPFFTTKEAGSGIGLSLGRQIMRLHGGSLGVRSVPGEQTTFTMVFP